MGVFDPLGARGQDLPACAGARKGKPERLWLGMPALPGGSTGLRVCRPGYRGLCGMRRCPPRSGFVLLRPPGGAVVLPFPPQPRSKAPVHPPGTVPQPSRAPQRPKSWGLHIWGLESMGLYLWGDVPGCCRVPWCHSPPRCHRSCHWPSCRGLRRAGHRLPGTAAAASWWPRLGSGCRGGTGGSRYLDGQRDRRTHGWHRRTWNHRAPVFRAPRGMQKVAPVPSSPVGARACVHGAALRQSHILSAPGLRWPPPARCGHGREL